MALGPNNPVKQSKGRRSPVDPIAWLESRDLGAKLEVCNLVSMDRQRAGIDRVRYPEHVHIDGIRDLLTRLDIEFGDNVIFPFDSSKGETIAVFIWRWGADGQQDKRELGRSATFATGTLNR